MKEKVWDITVKDNPNRVVMGENDEFYTTDTEAFLVFNLQDEDFHPQSAMITLENRNDGSLKSEEVEVTDGDIQWEMPERYIEHSGNWQAQLVYEQMKGGVPEKYTSGVMAFTVNSHIKDKKKPSLVEIENWEKFIREGTELIETWEDLEALREENERQRQANYQELLDTGVLQTNINTKLEALEEEYAPKLTEVTAQLAQIAINPTIFGAKFDGESDDSNAIQQAINYVNEIGSGEVLLHGEVGVGNTIEIKSGVTLHSYNATITALNDVNIIEFNRNTKIKGTLKIDVSSFVYTKSVLHFDGSKNLSYRDIEIDTIFLQGSDANGMGNAIHLEASDSNASVSFVYFNKVIIRGFHRGIFYDAPDVNASQNNYINGNIINDLTVSDCDYYLYLTGNRGGAGRNQVDGNGFPNVQLQYNTRAKEIIHVEGRNNYIEGFVWDTVNKDVTEVNLLESSANNHIEIYSGRTPDGYIDNGRTNYINVEEQYYDVIEKKEPYNLDPEHTLRFEGEYQDILHGSDKHHEISILEGESLITNGVISNIFNADTRNRLHLDLSDDKVFSFEIDFKSGLYSSNGNLDYLYSGLKNLGIVFEAGLTPKEVEFVIFDRDGATTTTTKDILDNSTDSVWLKRSGSNGLARHISKIIIRVKGQRSSEVRMSRVYASSYYITGNRYLSNQGGKLLGEVDLVDSYLALGVRNNMPAIHPSNYRKLIIVDDGSGDKLIICLKDENGEYYWKEL